MLLSHLLDIFTKEFVLIKRITILTIVIIGKWIMIIYDVDYKNSGAFTLSL